MATRSKARSKPKPARRKSVKTRAPRAGRKPARKAAQRRAPARRPPARKAAARRTTARATPTARAPVAAIPNGIGFVSQHMDYTSHDMEGVKRFYTTLLGFSDFREMTDGIHYLAVMTGPSSSLGFMPPMSEAPEQWQPPREPTLYLFVADVDRTHADLVRKGVRFEQAPQTMPWGHRVARLRDPEGRSVTLAQVLSR